MIRITRRVTVIQRVLLPTAATAGPTLWDRTPKLILCLLAVAFATAGDRAAVALQGGAALQLGLAFIGGVFGFYLVKLLPSWRLLLLAGALLAAVMVWLVVRP